MLSKQTLKDCVEFKSAKELAKIRRRFFKHEKFNIRLTIKDKKLSKHPAAKRYLKFVEKEINKIFNANKEAIAEVAMGLYPIYILHLDGKIEIIKDYYKRSVK